MALSAAEQEVITKRTEEMRAQMLEKFFTAFGDAGVKFDAEGIQRQIVADLTQERRKLALQMLGFDPRWSSIEVDHTNGRKNIASEFIMQHVGPAVEQWTNECLRPALEARSKNKLNDASVMSAVIKDFDRQFHYYAEKRLQQIAEQQGRAFADAVAAQITAGMAISQE